MDRVTRHQLIEAARASTPEVDPRTAQSLLSEGAIALDVREAEETAHGRISGALLVPRGFLELRIESVLPPTDRPVIVYCAGGTRSLLAAKTLQTMGYSDVRSLVGGFDGWKAADLPWEMPPQLSSDQRTRYQRHLLLPEIGEAGQDKLLKARVLLIGAGGLGSPVAYYLAAAGVGHLGVVDPDIVDRSNLQRQILHRDSDIGMPKVESAERAINGLNPDVKVHKFEEAFDAASAERILDHGWDVVVDGCDNFTTRYIVNDACVDRGWPNVHGSIYKFEGQVGVFSSTPEDACYRCLYPMPPPPELAPNCAEAGVLGVLPGIIGTAQALEALKLILGLGTSSGAQIAQFDAISGTWRVLRVKQDPRCAACGQKAA